LFFAFGQLLRGLGALLRGLFSCFFFLRRLGLADLSQAANSADSYMANYDGD
jgi:hypothetical protein